jgi:hypothetical protein
MLSASMVVASLGLAGLAGAGTCGHASDALHSRTSNAANRGEVNCGKGIFS